MSTKNSPKTTSAARAGPAGGFIGEDNSRMIPVEHCKRTKHRNVLVPVFLRVFEYQTSLPLAKRLKRTQPEGRTCAARFARPLHPPLLGLRFQQQVLIEIDRQVCIGAGNRTEVSAVFVVE